MAQADSGPDSEGLTDEDLLISVANTGFQESDELADAETISGWWSDLTADSPSSPESFPTSELKGAERLRALRSVIRQLAWANNGVLIEDDPGAEASLAVLALRPDFSGGRLSLRPGRSKGTVDIINAAGVAALMRMMSRPSWPRFKACHALDCGWVFIDRSRNLSRRWCDMGDCGNRAKGAAFRARAHQS
jgi:predicted RNA-binding Zn ribbon-like protein